jgi:hypothetical protein
MFISFCWRPEHPLAGSWWAHEHFRLSIRLTVLYRNEPDKDDSCHLAHTEI